MAGDRYGRSCGASPEPDDLFCGQCGAPRTAAADSAPSDPPAPTAPAAKGATSRKGPAFALAIVMLLVPLGLMQAVSDCGDAEGTLTVTGGPDGDFTIQAVACGSLQPYGRKGVGVAGADKDAGAVCISADLTTGYRVEDEVPGSCRNADGTGCTVVEVPREACTVFEANVSFNGTVVNDVRPMNGHVPLDCQLDDGTRVQGFVKGAGC